MKKVIISVLVVVLIAMVFGIWYLGLFEPINLSESELGPYKYVYESYTGPYDNTGPIFEKLYKDLDIDGIKVTRGIGFYYDNPQEVAPEKLRSDCGAIIEEPDYSKIEALKDKYHLKDFPKTPVLMARFPIRNMLSFMIGPMKVYPKMAESFDLKKYKPAEYGLEVYDMPNSVTYYAFPLIDKE